MLPWQERGSVLDCFALLAMTMVNDGAMRSGLRDLVSAAAGDPVGRKVGRHDWQLAGSIQPTGPAVAREQQIAADLLRGDGVVGRDVADNADNVARALLHPRTGKG